jgi:hypothetical protein
MTGTTAVLHMRCNTSRATQGAATAAAAGAAAGVVHALPWHQTGVRQPPQINHKSASAVSATLLDCRAAAAAAAFDSVTASEVHEYCCTAPTHSVAPQAALLGCSCCSSSNSSSGSVALNSPQP